MESSSPSVQYQHFQLSELPEAMSNRMQQGTGEERVVAESKPTLNLVSRSAASSPTPLSSSRGYSVHPVSKVRISQHNVQGNLPLKIQIKMTQRQVLWVWPTDAKLSERATKLAAAGTNQYQSFQGRARKLAAENSDINDEDDSKCPHTYRISRANVPHLEKVFSNLRQQLKRKPECF